MRRSRILANTYLGVAHYFLGDYQRCLDCTRRVVELLPRERSHESLASRSAPQSSRAGFLCWAPSDLGRF